MIVGIGVRAAMRGHGNDRDGSRAEPPRLLREALREARIEAATRTGVVVDLRDAEMARLELLHDELDPVFAEILSDIELFDLCLSSFYPHPQDVGCFQAPEESSA